MLCQEPWQQILPVNMRGDNNTLLMTLGHAIAKTSRQAVCIGDGIIGYSGEWWHMPSLRVPA